MKKAIVAAVAAAIGIGGAAFAPPAAADIDSYLYDLDSAGFHVKSGMEAKVLALGEAVCIDLYNGRPLRTLISDAVGMGFTNSQAAQFISISVADLCPQAAARITGGVA